MYLYTILSLVPILIWVKDTLPTDEEKRAVSPQDNERAEAGNVLRALLRRPLLIAFIFISIIYSMVYAQYSFGVPLYADQIFGPLGARYYGILMTVNAVLVVAFTIFIISSTSRIRPIINISIAGILYAVGFGMLYFSEALYLFIISTFFWTMGEILFTVNTSVFVTNNSPISHRARFNLWSSSYPSPGLPWLHW